MFSRGVFNLQRCFQGVNLLVEGFGAGFDAPVWFGGLVGSPEDGDGGTMVGCLKQGQVNINIKEMAELDNVDDFKVAR